ncbi:dynein light chain Tctex-type 5-B-like [Mytilus galloprovincialis]|uniref:TCTEX1D2 n=1 Tax=Mytilus edulis TaxID=6550 RepID=A0A8S3VBT0_MYTED|nr:TCTEX1D2 [Mytilus edulis]
MAGLTAQGRDLGTRVSSLFEIPDKRLTAIGSSITSYACDPRLSEDTGRPAKKVYYENTFKLEPDSKFRADKVKPIIDDIFAKNLEGRKYDPIECSILSKSLAEELKLKVKELNFKRYKIISLVTIGQQNDQGVRIGSRYLWDHERDSFACSSFHNKYVYAVGTVYALYYE